MKNSVAVVRPEPVDERSVSGLREMLHQPQTTWHTAWTNRSPPIDRRAFLLRESARRNT